VGPRQHRRWQHTWPFCVAGFSRLGGGVLHWCETGGRKKQHNINKPNYWIEALQGLREGLWQHLSAPFQHAQSIIPAGSTGKLK
jgi:hypothetical protein